MICYSFHKFLENENKYVFKNKKEIKKVFDFYLEKACVNRILNFDKIFKDLKNKNLIKYEKRKWIVTRLEPIKQKEETNEILNVTKQFIKEEIEKEFTKYVLPAIKEVMIDLIDERLKTKMNKILSEIF